MFHYVLFVGLKMSRNIKYDYFLWRNGFQEVGRIINQLSFVTKDYQLEQHVTNTRIPRTELNWMKRNRNEMKE